MIRHDLLAPDGTLIESTVVDLDAGTITYEVDGKVVESRQLTAEEAARYAPPPPSADERLADLLAALSKATTLAQIRAAAAKAAETA